MYDQMIKNTEPFSLFSLFSLFWKMLATHRFAINFAISFWMICVGKSVRKQCKMVSFQILPKQWKQWKQWKQLRGHFVIRIP